MIIDSTGVCIHPRLESLVSAESVRGQVSTGERLAVGVDGLDAMLHGGLPPGSVTLVPGVVGSGKTMLGLSFLTAGEDKGLFVGFHEAPDQIVAKSDGVQLPLRPAVESGRVLLNWHPAREFEVDQLAEGVLDTVRRRRIRRVVIDALDDLLIGLADPERTIRFVSALMNLLRAEKTAVLLTQELHQLFGHNVTIPLSEISAAADNIVLLRYAETRSDLRRFISILKIREQAYDSAIREFVITGNGISVGERFDVSTGAVQRDDSFPPFDS